LCDVDVGALGSSIIFTEAFQRAQRVMAGAERVAETDAGDISYPPEMFTRDAIALREAGSLAALVRLRQEARAHSRFNLSRFNRLYPDDPEADRLRTLASSGARIDTAPSFQPEADPPPMRTLLSRVPNSIRKHVFKLWTSGDVLVLPLDELTSADDIHTSNLHCVFQDPVNKPGGRLLGDLTNRPSGSSLNHPDARPLIEERWGTLHLPTITDIIADAFAVAHVAGGLQNIRLFKEDVVGAFGQFNIDAEDARLLAFEFFLGFVLIYIAGMFGWMGAPAVFGVLTRAMSRRISKTIHHTSRSSMYVDDVMVFSARQHAASDQASVKRVIEDTLGEGKACPKKSQPPSLVGDIIGWTIDLVNETLRPNAKGIDALLRNFSPLLRTSRLTWRQYSTLASLASRYSQAMIGMRPFVAPLFRMISAARRHGTVSPSAEAWTAITMWQAATVVLVVSPGHMAISLHRFSPVPPDHRPVLLVSDAGPDAIGLLLHVDDQLLGYVTYDFPFAAHDPEFQNCREYLGHLLGKVLFLKLRRQRPALQSIRWLHWTGDNSAALSWVRKHSCSSTRTQFSFLASSWLDTIHHLPTGDPDHLPGVRMGVVDDLSRHRPHNLDTRFNLAHLLDERIHRLFMLCDPTPEHPDESLTPDHLTELLGVLRGIHLS
jgi:hypothetical protein